MGYAQSAYNTVTHGISVTVGTGVGMAVSGFGTAGSFGAATIPAIAGGVVIGTATTMGVETLFDKIEEIFWGEAK